MATPKSDFVKIEVFRKSVNMSEPVDGHDGLYETTCHDTLRWFGEQFASEIIAVCGVDDSNEWNMGNFGLSSPWCYESPFELVLEFVESDITLVIRQHRDYGQNPRRVMFQK